MGRALSALSKAAETVAAAMLAAIFATFLFQIAARYVFAISVGWTIEVTLTLWLWLVLFTCAFVLRERDHVRFDVLVVNARSGTRRIYGVLSAAVIVVALVAAMPDSWDYVTFYKIKRSAVLRVPLIWIFSIYLVFCGVLILRYAWRVVAIVRGHDPGLDQRDHPLD